MPRPMPRVEHRAWDLDPPVADDRHWLTEISCRIAEPHWWEVHGQSISKQNRQALDICAGCLHGGLGTGGRCERAARYPNQANSGYSTDGVIMAGALWKHGVPYIPSRCPRCNRPYLWRWQAGGTPDHRCPVPAAAKPDVPELEPAAAEPMIVSPPAHRPWNVLAA